VSAPATPLPPGLVGRLATARRVAALTGAGVSAESGVPTFREAQTGLWARFRPEDLATAEAFAADPKTVWAWYEWRRDLVSAAAPNPGHHALAALESLVPEFTLITQNVDGLHARAGSRRVLEFHGNLFENRCFAGCGATAQVPRPCPEPSRCLHCGAWLRPGVVWFGEAIPVEALQAARAAVDRCEVLLVIGTSALVQPAASLALRADAVGAMVAEINVSPTGLDGLAQFRLAGPSGELLPRLVAAVRTRRQTRS
jgi:NAD-dependent deacetylase